MMPDTLPVESLEAAFGLGSWKSIQRLPGGKSQHYHIVTARGEYVLRCSYASKALDDVRFEHQLIAHLRDHDFPAPEFVPCRNGETYVVVDGQLYCASVYVHGSAYQPGNLNQLHEVAHTLARYHKYIASFVPVVARPSEPYLSDTLKRRIEDMPSDEAINTFLAAQNGHSSSVSALFDVLPQVLMEADGCQHYLATLYPNLPLLFIHGGCRRASTLFSQDHLIAMLDFDSARFEARVMDLAIAFHDFGKIFGVRGSPDFKVPLDLNVISQFVNAYVEVNPLEPAELEALPLILAARPLKRALGKYSSMVTDLVISPGHIRKTAQEIARVRWLDLHLQDIEVAVLARPGRVLKKDEMAHPTT